MLANTRYFVKWFLYTGLRFSSLVPYCRFNAPFSDSDLDPDPTQFKFLSKNLNVLGGSKSWQKS